MSDPEADTRGVEPASDEDIARTLDPVRWYRYSVPERKLAKRADAAVRRAEEAERERDECLLHPDGSFTGTDAGRWQCDQCAANDQYRERFFTAEAEVRRAEEAEKANRMSLNIAGGLKELLKAAEDQKALGWHKFNQAEEEVERLRSAIEQATADIAHELTPGCVCRWCVLRSASTSIALKRRR